MKKEIYLKQIVFLTDDIKWWMNVLLGLLSGAVGFLFALTQQKVIVNNYLFTFSIIIVIIGVFTIIKIKKLKIDRQKLLDKFEKDKKC